MNEEEEPGSAHHWRRKGVVAVATLFAVGLTLGACGDDGGVSLQSGSSGAPAVVPAAAPLAVEPGPDVELPDALSLSLTPVLEAVQPIAMATHPKSGAVFLATKAGVVAAVDLTAGTTGPALLDIGDGLADDFIEQGLLGMAWSPDGEFLYLNFTDANHDTVVAEYPAANGAIDAEAGREVLRVEQPADNHNGGHMVFGPDRFLYIGLGDGGGSDDEFGNGQDPATLLASILRIDPRPSGDAPYAVPADNPFVDGGGRAEIYLWGARNPWRFSFDRLTADLWIADVGQDAIEEVDVLYASDGLGRGANLGWSAVEGSLPFAASSPPTEDYAAPIYEYNRDDGCSITGGYVYRGQNIEALQGHYIFGDYCTSELWGLATSERQGLLGRFDLGLSLPERSLVSFFEDEAGELYVLGFDDMIYRIDPG